jgi:hypothetical protein
VEVQWAAYRGAQDQGRAEGKARYERGGKLQRTQRQRQEGEMKDIPTPEHDALFRGSNDRSLGDELCMVYVLAHSLEQRLAIAVAALKESERLIWKFPAKDAIVCIQKALAQIMEKK